MNTQKQFLKPLYLAFQLHQHTETVSETSLPDLRATWTLKNSFWNLFAWPSKYINTQKQFLKPLYLTFQLQQHTETVSETSLPDLWATWTHRNRLICGSDQQSI